MSPPTLVQSDVPRVLHIIVNYRRAQLCLDLAKNILSLSDSAAVRVQIVDNSETAADHGLLIGGAVPEKISITTPPRNLGFYGGADFGLTTYLSEHPLPDWVIISNPDVVFPDHKFLTRLLEIEPTPELGALAPDIRLGADAKRWDTDPPQNPLMELRPSAQRLRLLEMIHGSAVLYTLLLWRNRLRREHRPQATGRSRAIYAPHGSAIIFSRNYFERGGTLKHGVFLYGEELFVAEELRLRGLKCLFEPDLKLSHVGGATTKALGDRKQRLHNYEALRFIRRRYYDSEARNA